MNSALAGKLEDGMTDKRAFVTVRTGAHTQETHMNTRALRQEANVIRFVYILLQHFGLRRLR